MEDLLGLGDSASPPPPPPPPSPQVFELAPAEQVTLDAAAFQDLWGKWAANSTEHRPMRPGLVVQTGPVEQCLRASGLRTMASGQVPPSTSKFYFVARQQTGPAPNDPAQPVWFLLELIMTQNGTAQAQLKALNAQNTAVSSFMKKLWEGLAQFVQL